MRFTRRSIAGVVVLACATLAAQQSSSPRSSVSGVYTAEQATTGERIYFDRCATCHGAELGGIERAPALTGSAFNESWQGQDLRRLRTRVVAMPPNAPGSLSDVDVAAVMAFILRSAGMPAGRESLPGDPAQLASIVFGQVRDAGALGAQRGVAPAAPAPAAPVPAPAAPDSAPAAAAAEWTTYGGNLASQRHSPADQITADNFNQLQLVWRLKTDFLGPRPDTLYSATPLVVGRTLYTTAGMRRAAIALDAATGEMRWMHAEDEGRRGDNAPRNGAGRGLSYWSNADGTDRRVLYVTPGYRMIALDADTGQPVRSFGQNGVIDLKLEADQEIDLDTGELGLNATPLVVGDVIVVGAALRPGGAPRTLRNQKGYVRGYDVRTGKRLWIFHTIPWPGEFGYETWLEGSADLNGNTGVWSQMSADAELGLVYVPTEMPTGDYYGGHRPGNTLFADTILALDVKTGTRKWHYQTVHHDVWDWDLPAAPMLFDTTVNGQPVKALAQPTKSAFLFVLNRETGEPVWPIEERAVPQSDVLRERTSPTQPFPTRPVPFDRQGVAESDLIDFTPALRAEALELIKRYKIGPIFTPPVLSRLEGPLGTLQLPADVGGANWPGGAMDPESNFLYIHSHTNVYVNALVPGDPERTDMLFVSGQARAAGPGPRAGGAAGGAANGGRGRAGTTVQGLPLIKPPYDRITAYDMNTGEMVWQKPHSSTPDDIRNHPALSGVDLPTRLGQPGRTFIGVLATKSLLIAGEGGVHTNDAGRRVALLRAYDKRTGADVGAVEMPQRQTGSPMTYVVGGRQYIVLAVSGNDGAELLAYALP
ncbi:MAG: PQQ-binding-like beta-propeller repeat protein [Vicinamibacterales bacterium]